MRDFNRSSKKRFGRRDSGNFGRRDSGRFDRTDSSERFKKRDFESSGRNSEQRMMHQTTCDKCGNKCEVPFRPTGNKPVYCSDCFRKNEYSESRSNSNLSSGELEQINEKLDKILKALNID